MKEIFLSFPIVVNNLDESNSSSENLSFLFSVLILFSISAIILFGVELIFPKGGGIGFS